MATQAEITEAVRRFQQELAASAPAMSKMLALDSVARAATQRRKNATEWRGAILDARDAGCTLEQIARAAGLSRARIHQILKGGTS